MRLISVPLDLVDVARNVRTDPGEIEALAASIAELGVLQPIRVRQVGDRWAVVYGQRRVLAARKAGLTEIPATVQDEPSTSPTNIAIEQLAENIQREELNAIDEAVALRVLVESGVDQRTLGRAIGKSGSYVSNTLRLLTLARPVRELIADGELTRSHGKELCALSVDDQVTFGQRAVDEEWSTAELGRRVGIQLRRSGASWRGSSGGRYTGPRAEPDVAAARALATKLRRLADRIERELSTRPPLPLDTHRRIAADIRAAGDELVAAR